MKPLILIILICFLIACFVVGRVGYILGLKHEQDKVSWPEEITALSTDSLKPDTLTAYKSGKTIRIGFFH